MAERSYAWGFLFVLTMPTSATVQCYILGTSTSVHNRIIVHAVCKYILHIFYLLYNIEESNSADYSWHASLLFGTIVGTMFRA